MFCRGAKITTSNADHFPALSTPAVSRAIIFCASSRTIPPLAAIAAICGPADR